MSDTSLQLNKAELQHLEKGVELLINESLLDKATLSVRLVPGDNNVPMLLEYYDKRHGQLSKLKTKLRDMISTST